MDTVTPAYDENVIVKLINELYTLFIDLAYIQPADVLFPPPDGEHTLSAEILAVFEELDLSPAVFSFISRIPFPRLNGGGPEVYAVEAGFLCFTDEKAFRMSRDPDSCFRDPIDYTFLSRDEVIFTEAQEAHGAMLILNTTKNTIRNYTYWFDTTEPEPAPAFLQNWIDNIRSLRWIPRIHVCGDYRLVRETDDEKVYFDLKRVLQEDYGWPDQFRKDDWARDAQRVWYEVENRFHDDRSATISKQSSNAVDITNASAQSGWTNIGRRCF